MTTSSQSWIQMKSSISMERINDLNSLETLRKATDLCSYLMSHWRTRAPTHALSPCSPAEITQQ
ncbi:hypothetical protein D9C73_001611 [Collichthys lucidus]|uniref:Uncharacterized protein n=1 Tax=Collichthys lucidus TaxID=240159 RepID=A0A4U5TZC3_COLLU|nr:hypothetical protein D9C73_001611 [Collichthys lucidus]